MTAMSCVTQKTLIENVGDEVKVTNEGRADGPMSSEHLSYSTKRSM